MSNPIADIFKGLHGALNENNLTLLSTLIDRKVISEKLYKEAVNYLGVDEDYLFYDPSAILSPMVYYDGLIYCDLYNLDINALKFIKVKERLYNQIKDFNTFLKEKKFDELFMFMDKRLLIPSFIRMYDEMPIKGRYEIFVTLYIRSETGFEMFTDEFLKKVFSERRLSKEWAARMRLFKKEAIKNEAGLIAVFHGHNKEYNPHDVYSWTLSKKTAQFFANRFEQRGVVEKKYILSRDVIDYFQSRGEQEVILKTHLIK